MKHPISIVALTLLAALPLSCASHHHHPKAAADATISGTVTYPGRLPADASLTVYLVENTQITDTVEVLANEVLNFKNGSPVAFKIAYTPAEVETDNRYSLGARATDLNGKVILKSNAYLVLTKGGPSDNVTIVMTPAK